MPYDEKNSRKYTADQIVKIRRTLVIAANRCREKERFVAIDTPDGPRTGTEPAPPFTHDDWIDIAERAKQSASQLEHLSQYAFAQARKMLDARDGTSWMDAIS